MLAHAALLAAFIWFLPSPLPQPTQWVLAYFVELAPAGGPGAPAPGADASLRATPELPRSSHEQPRAKRTDVSSAERPLISPRPAAHSNTGEHEAASERDAALTSVTAMGAGAKHAGNGVTFADGDGASRIGGGGLGRDGVAVASADYARSPLPRYPDYARRHDQQGTVTLRVLVAADGAVRAVEVAESSGFESLDDTALATVRDRWRFTPARRGATAVESWVLVPIRFALEDGRASR
ncbi:MAG: energy transducer TonB [Candidatus Binataceae bacterium]